jgi:cyanophycin synthetase
VEVLRTSALLRPNVWGPIEACDATIRVDASDVVLSCESLSARLHAVLPEFGRVPCPAPPAVEEPEGGGHVRLLCRLTLALQLAGRESSAVFSRVISAGEPGMFRAGIESLDPGLVAFCLHEAVTVLQTLGAGRLPDIDAIRSKLIDQADEVCLGPSTMLIVGAAEERGIPWRRLSDLSLVQLGHGRFQRRIWTAETDRTPAIAEAISRNKQLTKRLLDAAGIPVPRGKLVASPAEAWDAAMEIGLPAVVKPLDGNHGRGVFVGLTTREEVEYAFGVARAEARPHSPVMVEECIPGVEHRLLVINSRLVACARGEQLFVTGDGRHTVAQLIETQLNSDPRRGRSETLPNKSIELDDTVRLQIGREGLEPDSILAAGRRVLVKQTGSHCCDVTDEVHPEVAALAVRAARTVGLDVAGIDVVATDISRPLHAQGARICEVNAGPQLLIHADPGQGIVRPVGRTVVDMLFAPGETGRIPIIAMLGFPADDLTTDLEASLRAAGRSPAMTGPLGKWVAGIRCNSDDCSRVDDARAVLVSTDIDVAIFGLDWRSVAQNGSPVDRIDVLVLGPFPADGVTAGPAGELDSPRAAVRALVAAVPTDAVILLAHAPSWARELLATRSPRGIDATEIVATVTACLA